MSLCTCIILLTLLPLINGQTAPEVVLQDAIVVLGANATIDCSYTLSGTRGFFSSAWYNSTSTGNQGNLLVNSRGTNPNGRYGIHITQSTAQTGVATLIIANTLLTDDGYYLCTIIDDFGENSRNHAELDVYYIGDVMINISSTTVPYLTITCSVNSNPVPQLDLYHNNNLIMTKTEMTLTYIKSTVTEADDGDYYCKASNTVGTAMSNTITLDYYGQTSPDLVLQDAIGILGDNTTIDCSYTLSGTRGLFSSVWYESTSTGGQGNFLVNSRGTNPDGRYGVNITQVTQQTGISTLTIANTELTDDGYYLCVIVDDVGEQGSNNAKLNVHYIGDVMINVSSTTDPSFNMTCYVNGNPVPHLNLYHHSNIIVSETASTLSYKRGQTSGDDNGEYYCEASNTAGTVTSNIIKIDYYITDVIFNISSATKVNFTMTCFVNSNPVPQLNLYHNGTLIKTDTTSLKHTRHLVSEDDDGEYCCEASNTVGTVRSNAITLDYYKPEFELPEYMIVEFGEDVVISIDNMSANPSDVTYQWAIDDPDIRDTDTNPATFSFTASDDVKSTYVISLDVENVIGSKTDSMIIFVSCSYSPVSETCNKTSKGLTTGIFFVGIFVGACGVIVGHIIYTKIKQKKLTDNKIVRKPDKKKQAMYMEYMSEPSSPTYQDLQHGTQEESAYVSVKPANNDKI